MLSDEEIYSKYLCGFTQSPHVAWFSNAATYQETILLDLTSKEKKQI